MKSHQMPRRIGSKHLNHNDSLIQFVTLFVDILSECGGFCLRNHRDAV